LHTLRPRIRGKKYLAALYIDRHAQSGVDFLSRFQKISLDMEPNDRRGEQSHFFSFIASERGRCVVFIHSKDSRAHSFGLFSFPDH